MCVKFPLGDLNPDPCPPHPTNTYTYGVTIAPKMCGDKTFFLMIALLCRIFNRVMQKVKQKIFL